MLLSKWCLYSPSFSLVSIKFRSEFGKQPVRWPCHLDVVMTHWLGFCRLHTVCDLNMLTLVLSENGFVLNNHLNPLISQRMKPSIPYKLNILDYSHELHEASCKFSSTWSYYFLKFLTLLSVFAQLAKSSVVYSSIVLVVV